MTEYASKHVLVTGAAGFLGSHLCDILLARGYQVAGLDNLHTGRMVNLREALTKSNFSFFEHDVETPLEGRYDQIYHLACPASPPFYQEDPIKTARTAFLGTLNMLALAKSCGARFFLASTSEIYGDPDVHPQVESYRGNVNPIGPRACYDEGKRMGETLAFDFQRCYGTDIRVVRIFNTYGPRMNPVDGRVVSNFIVQALGGEDITIYGEGQQTRSFCYYEDLLDGFIKLMENDRFQGPVNLGNPNEFTIRELADLILEMTGSGSKLVVRPMPVDDPKMRQPNIDLAREKLDWSPKIELRDGLAKTIEHFRNVLMDRK